MAESRLIATAHDVEQSLGLMEMLSMVPVDGQNLLALRGHKALEIHIVSIFRPFDEQVLQVQVDSARPHNLDACPIRLASSTTHLIVRHVLVKPEQIARD